MNTRRVLVVENDPQLQRLLRAQLLALEFAVRVESRGEDAIIATAEFEPDVMLLALSLPGIGGVETCRRLREWTHIPIIALNGEEQEQIKVVALDSGADDCVTKPFSMAELLARMRAVLRRAGDWATAPEHAEPLNFHNLKLDLVNRSVFMDDQPLHLTPTEYGLLYILATHAGRVLTHRELLTRVWGPESSGDTQYLHVFVGQLRRKLEPAPCAHRHILTEPGVGYRFAAD
jgi:two-component system KDP operon response regulator KdpE